MRTTLLVSLSLLLAACPDPAKNKAKAVVEAPKEVPAAAAAPAALEGSTTYGFNNEGSKFTFVGAKVTGKHEGGFNAFNGKVVLKGKDLSTAQISATITPASVYSDSEKLTGHLQSPDFFDVEKFPEASFVSTGVKAAGDAFEVTGNLTLHGVTKSITFPAKLALTDDTVTARADFAINRKDFEIVYAGKADDLIADNVAIGLDLNAKKQ